MKKIRLEDLTEKHFEDARQIVAEVVSWQTQPSIPKYILPLIAKIKSLTKSGNKKSLHASLRAGLDAGLSDGLHDGLYAGLHAGLSDGLHAGLDAGLDAGLHDGLRAGLNDGLYAGLHDGLDDGLNAGLYAGLNDDLDVGLRDGLYAGLSDGLHDGLRDGLPKSNLKGKVIYCGIFWAWWLARYLIAARFGCKLDMGKLSLLYGFVRLTPIILEINGKIVIAKPTKIKWNITGKTKAPFEFPIYELHSDGESTVECAGLKLYYHHNTKLPEYIGKTKIKDWKPEWALQETNQQIKRVLLANIPSKKLADVLQLKVLDTWNSGVSLYELVEAKNNPFPSPYKALRTRCPSTNDEYLLRVAPEMTSAETAAVFLNMGIHPHSFYGEH